jgi:mitogen-activated protein kinase 7
MIAQEVMTFKAQKQGLPPLQLGATNLKRKESLSANDREALERSRDVAKDVDNNSNSNRNSSSVAASAAPVAQNRQDNMDVDALERELGGGI